MGSAARKAVYGNPNPPPLTLWSVQESQGLVAGSEGAASGTGTVGDSDLWAKNSHVQLQLSNGPAAVLAQPSLKEMLGLCWLKKTKKSLCHFQKDTKAMGHVTQTFPIAF